MYCSNCRKKVDINSVAVAKPKGALTMFNEDGLGLSTLSGDNSTIVNVCKECGQSDCLWQNKATFDSHRRKIELEKQVQRKREEKWAAPKKGDTVLIVLSCVSVPLMVLGLLGEVVSWFFDVRTSDFLNTAMGIGAIGCIIIGIWSVVRGILPDKRRGNEGGRKLP